MSELENWKEEARRVLEIESKALVTLGERLDSSFDRAVDLLHNCGGKVIVTGMGKSGLVGRKISATLSSTGTPAVFLHPAESSHGDMGLISSDDMVFAISYGGGSPELSEVIKFVARKGIPLLVMTSKVDGDLAKAADVCLDVTVEEEACPLRLAPTTSTTVTMALGDALAISVMKKKGFQKENFAEFHPGGSLGKKLLTRVSDVMHGRDSLPLVKLDSSMREVIAEMTGRSVRGVAGVIDSNESLVGIITDGDIRRHLEKGGDILNGTVDKYMSLNPKTIRQDELAEKAVFTMQEFSIQTLFVLDHSELNGNASANNRPVGLIHLQDLLKYNFR